MQADHNASPDPMPADGRDAHVALSSLRAACERQAEEIRTLSESLDLFRRGAHGLSRRNAELRSNMALFRALAGGRSSTPEVQRWERRLPVGDEMMAVSRSALADALRDQVPHGVLARAQAIVAALLADRRRGGSADAQPPVILRIESSATTIKVELDDPCHPGMSAATGNDGAGGLRVLQQLSHRWGGERLDNGGMRIWAQLSLLDPVGEAAPV